MLRTTLGTKIVFLEKPKTKNKKLGETKKNGSVSGEGKKLSKKNWMSFKAKKHYDNNPLIFALTTHARTPL